MLKGTISDCSRKPHTFPTLVPGSDPNKEHRVKEAKSFLDRNLRQ